MTTWMRGVLLVIWLAGVSWLWHAGVLGSAATLAAFALGFAALAWTSTWSRRRRSALRYIEMGKQPVSLL
ncbi:MULTISPECIES: hypothetical protein [unclassified Variovorax]|uniref:hypothetical protein n=1 Tax=unclassified Variovorax TaxID=663243 RepID=UPI0013196142|nr:MULTISPECIES: hypothetical protein [unclassified Variovorax]VTU30541.1 hypothetical protein SRS16CHR_04698 [Variovorax sp. SRS16]VTU38121.1 hypothetical protein E5CHR_04740 [Variovorax sp. PBL-E5]